jgi:ferrous iron transport protein A
LRENVALDTINHPISLDRAKKGQHIKIHTLPRGAMRAQFIRVGINTGVRVKCLERLPGGTIVLQKNRQEIAIGQKLAHQIIVVPIDHEG